MTTLEKLLAATAALKQVCEEVGEAGYMQPTFAMTNVPREVFDEIPAISRIDDDDPDFPTWEKRYKGLAYHCFQAPMVKL